MALKNFSEHNWFNDVLYILGYKVIVNVYEYIFMINPNGNRKIWQFSYKI